MRAVKIFKFLISFRDEPGVVMSSRGSTEIEARRHVIHHFLEPDKDKPVWYMEVLEEEYENH